MLMEQITNHPPGTGSTLLIWFQGGSGWGAGGKGGKGKGDVTEKQLHSQAAP